VSEYFGAGAPAYVVDVVQKWEQGAGKLAVTLQVGVFSALYITPFVMIVGPILYRHTL